MIPKGLLQDIKTCVVMLEYSEDSPLEFKEQLLDDIIVIAGAIKRELSY